MAMKGADPWRKEKLSEGRCTDVNKRKNRKKIKEHKLCQERVHSDKLGDRGVQKGAQNTRKSQMRIKGKHSALLRGCQLSPGIHETSKQKSMVQ